MKNNTVLYVPYIFLIETKNLSVKKKCSPLNFRNLGNEFKGSKLLYG